MVEIPKSKFGAGSSTLLIAMLFLIAFTFLVATPFVIVTALYINKIFPGYKGIMVIASLAAFITLPMSILGGAAFYGLIERDVLGVMLERWHEMSTVRRR